MNKVGFGFLRLPFSGDEPDYTALNTMVDAFFDRGGRYFDTAYTYLGGKSEEAIRRCVTERYPRESFLLADKLPGYKAASRSDCDRFFAEQLRRCGVEYFDVYMLHWLNAENYAVAERVDEFAFLRELKASGRARRIGFSYHDSAALLDEILTRHPEVDVVQIQLNYLDWESESIQARLCYETIARHGKKVIVMEPVKGGTLAAVPDEAMAILDALAPGESAASHAIRFASSLPEVETVLSGMNTLAQVEDNMRDLDPLPEEHTQALQRVAAILRGSIAVACTGCRYCVEHCPQNIPIPNYFALLNDITRFPAEGWKIKPVYERLCLDHSKASDCLACRSCEAHCPQSLAISEHMKKVAEALEN